MKKIGRRKKICKWNNSFVEKRNKIQYQTLFTLFDGCVGNPSMVYHQPNEEKGDEQKNPGMTQIKCFATT